MYSIQGGQQTDKIFPSDFRITESGNSSHLSHLLLRKQSQIVGSTDETSLATQGLQNYFSSLVNASCEVSVIVDIEHFADEAKKKTQKKTHKTLPPPPKKNPPPRKL